MGAANRFRFPKQRTTFLYAIAATILVGAITLVAIHAHRLSLQLHAEASAAAWRTARERGWFMGTGDLFQYRSISPDPPDATYNETFGQLISGKGVQPDPTPCLRSRRLKEHRRLAKEILQYWDNLAAEESIPYMLTYGSVIAYARNKDFIPWDHDVDVMMPSWSYARLLQRATPWPIYAPETPTNFSLILLPPQDQAMQPHRRTWTDCNRNKWYRTLDVCGFRVLLGRVSHGDMYMDLYAADHLPEMGIAVLRENKVVVAPPEIFFPRRVCTFMGVSTYCPNDYRGFVLKYYGAGAPSHLIPDHACRHGEFVHKKLSPNPPDVETTDLIPEYTYEDFCRIYPLDPELYTDCRFASKWNAPPPPFIRPRRKKGLRASV